MADGIKVYVGRYIKKTFFIRWNDENIFNKEIKGVFFLIPAKYKVR